MILGIQKYWLCHMETDRSKKSIYSSFRISFICYFMSFELLLSTCNKPTTSQRTASTWAVDDILRNLVSLRGAKASATALVAPFLNQAMLF